MKPNKKNAENAASYDCETCDFSCSKKSNYDNHLLTLKHKKLTNPNYLNSKLAEKKFQCHICSKVYKHASTLSVHKKLCKAPEPINIPEISLVTTDIESLTTLVINLPCSQKEEPPHSLQAYLFLPCSQIPLPLHSIQ